MIIDQIVETNKKHISINSENTTQSDKTVRSVVKSISWRVVGTLDTILISWIITGKVALALTIGSIELVTKMVLYFFHERIWNLIKWGKQ